MAKFYIPYKVLAFTNANVRQLNLSLQSIEQQLRSVPQETFKTDRTLFLPPAAFANSIFAGGTNFGYSLKNSVLTAQTYYANIDILNKSTITSIVAYWYRDDALATGDCDLYRSDFQENASIMATADSDATTGFHNVTDASVVNGSLDYDTYMYYVQVSLDPNDAVTDVRFQGVEINYSVQV